MPLAKLDLLGSDEVVERVFKSVAAAATTDNRINVTKGMRDGGIGRWPCAAAHMSNRVNNNSSVDLLPRVLRAV